MFEKKKTVVIFPSFGNQKVVEKTLPSVLAEVDRTPGAMLIVHDSTTEPLGREKKWKYLKKIEATSPNIFLLLSSNLAMGLARNMCMQLAIEMYAPDNIAMMEDDHGMHSGFLADLEDAMQKYYGQQSPNGLLFGLFGGCKQHNYAPEFDVIEGKHLSPKILPDDNRVGIIGGVNPCFIAAPTSHWVSVLKGFDVDQYLISNVQTRGNQFRNYHHGFTNLCVDGGKGVFFEDVAGRGDSNSEEFLWDEQYTRSDLRAKYNKKPYIK